MRAGALDRRVVIQSATTAQDASGQPIETWSTFATVWAERKDLRGSERFASEQELALRTATFRIRWLSGLHEEMRVVDAGTTYDLVGIADDRRQGWMELACEATNPQPVTA